MLKTFCGRMVLPMQSFHWLSVVFKCSSQMMFPKVLCSHSNQTASFHSLTCASTFPCSSLVFSNALASSVRAVSNDPPASDSAPTSLLDIKTYTPRRAMLYVPGDDERKLKKIPGINADCVILECEEGVARSRKAEARNTIAKVLDEISFGHTEVVLRINSIASGFAEEDLRVILQANNLPSTIAVPKVYEPNQIEWIAEKVSSILKERQLKKTFNLIIYIESALGVLNFESICRLAVELSEMGSPLTLDAVVYGSDDFTASIGAQRTPDAKEQLYARQKVLLVAKAFQLQAIDMVHVDLKDLEGLRQQSIEGAQMGYNGKQVIHPSHVPIVQDAFSPQPEKVEWATELIKEFEEHQKRGKGAFIFRGSMIDMSVLRQAKNIVQLMESIQAANQ